MTEPGLGHAIDFGTSTSSIVVSEPGGALTPIRDPALSGGPPYVRTALCVRPDGRVAVGQEAENLKRLYPGAYRSEFKRDFGDQSQTAPGGVAMTADQMAVHVIRFLRQLAEQAVPGKASHVVATVPASWAGGKRDLMRKVLERAGYGEGTEIELISEPVAAVAYAFSGHEPLRQQLSLLVYDLGGGTFDCAIARGDTGWFDVLGYPDGAPDIGGGAFDRRLLRLIRDRYPDSLPPPLDANADDPDVIRRWLSLKDTCEAIKWRLTEEDSTEELLTELTPNRYLTLSRAEFEATIRPLLDETLDICERLLKEQFDMGWADVDRIVPVGGSSSIPMVGELITRRSGRPVLSIDTPEMAVVLGAAQWGRELHGTAPRRRVFVNNRQTVLSSQDVGYDELVQLAQDKPTGRYFTTTITYERGPRENPAGILSDRQRVRLADEMVFNVVITNRS